MKCLCEEPSSHPDVINIMDVTFQLLINSPTANRSVYVIVSPYRENLLAKEDRLVVGGTACANATYRPSVTFASASFLNSCTMYYIKGAYSLEIRINADVKFNMCFKN
jgi:hypothetical protein